MKVGGKGTYPTKKGKKVLKFKAHKPMKVGGKGTYPTKKGKKVLKIKAIKPKKVGGKGIYPTKKGKKAKKGKKVVKKAKKVVKKAKKVVKKAKKVVKKKAAKKSAFCSLKVSKNGRCGKAFGNTRCTKAGVFCSKWNWCGTSALHKKTHQPKYDGRSC